MEMDAESVETILTALGGVLPVDLLKRLDVEQYLDQVDHVVGLRASERQSLGDLLRVAEHLPHRQMDDTSSERRQKSRKLGVLTARERDAVLEFQHRKAGMTPVSGKFALGNILVANDQITRAQLEDALSRQVETGRRLGEELVTAGHASNGQVEGGLMLQRDLIAYGLAVAVGLAPISGITPTAEAAQRSANILVSAVVIANATMHSDYQATQINITQADVVRGYMDIPAATRFSVSANSRYGYLVQFQPVGHVFDSVNVNGLGAPVHLGVDGGTVVQRGLLAPNHTHELSYHFILTPDVQPGNHPWPLQLSVRPL